MKFWFAPTTLVFLMAFGAGAQPPSAGHLDSLVQLSQRHYNAQQPDSLYRRLTPDFKQLISPAGWQTFLTDTHAQTGRWLRSEPVGTADGFTNYKATFERKTMLFRLAADANGRIAGFGLSPYAAPTVGGKKLATSNPLRTTSDRRLDSTIRAYNAQDPLVGLSIGILHNDSLFIYGYGETATGNGQLPDGNTLFEIGSVTKTFTATLLADAVRRGLLGLDDPVSRYLPDSIPPLQKDGVAVTVGMLANHTSGLPRLPGNLMTPGFSMQNPYRLYDRSALSAFLKKASLSNVPGTTYQYSNLGVGLLGTILELKTGQSFEQQLQTVITNPLGMAHTKVALTAADRTMLAQGHTQTGQPTPNWDLGTLAGAGAIRSTVNDLLIYVRAELGKGPEPLVQLMRTTQQITFKNDQRTIGLAWHQNHAGPDVWFMHNGGTGGYASFVGFNPQNKTALVMLANAAVKIDDLAFGLILAGRL